MQSIIIQIIIFIAAIFCLFLLTRIVKYLWERRVILFLFIVIPIVILILILFFKEAFLNSISDNEYFDEVQLGIRIIITILCLFLLIGIVILSWAEIAMRTGIVEKNIELVICKDCYTEYFPLRIRGGESLGKFFEIFFWIIWTIAIIWIIWTISIISISHIGAIWVALISGLIIIPIAVTIWRNAKRYSLCKKCGGKNVVLLVSPEGRTHHILRH